MLDQNPYVCFSADTPFGGLVTKTAHIFYALGLNKRKVVYSHGKNVENSVRDYGYGIKKRNIPFELFQYFDPGGQIFLAEMHRNLLMGKNEDNQKFLDLDNIVFSLTDTKFMPPDKLLNIVKSKWRFVAIRKTIANFYEKKLGIKIDFVPHMWYKFDMKPEMKKYVDDIGLKKGCIACCRLDYGKKIDMIFDSNDALSTGHINTCYVSGASVSGIYNYHTLGLDRLKKYWKGKFDKTWEKVTELHAPAKFGINLSDFPADGGGTENTTLEYIYHNTAVILHRNWIKKGKEFSGGSEFEEGYNCFAVESAEELTELLRKNPDTDDIVKEAGKIIDFHSSNKVLNCWSKYVK